ncbi:MAG TPA: metallopeptidase TldD-related protein [Bryobacteraceae bacterium]|nr:metallopeptidase TldD-related protein [Bryobacteraceae bacterium]
MSAPAAKMNYDELAGEVVRMARAGGATDSECTISEGEEFSVSVRMGEVETLTEAGSRGAGIRVLVGKHTGSAYTSDLSADGIRHMVHSALELAKITTEDPFAGLPDEADAGQILTDLQLYSGSVAALEAPFKIDQAKRAEAAALAVDPRIFNSEGGSFDTNLGYHVFANSRGFAGSYRTSSCSMSTVPLAKQGESMERDYWFTLARSVDRLETPEEVGRKAAERALRRLGARKVSTTKVPIVFEPRTANSLLSNIFEAVSGDSIYRQESFLAGRLGEKVASENITVIDDATIPGLFGSSPFDDEGVPSRRTVVIENGVLRSYLLNSYTARKLGMKTTGNASRGLTGNAGVGHGNFHLKNGSTSLADLIKSVENGFYVTELMGFGVNIVTGDYSRGAAGLWIENGELAYAVSEVTIAGTLQEMLLGIETVGSDLEFRGSVASPTILIGEMTVSGQ